MIQSLIVWNEYIHDKDYEMSNESGVKSQPYFDLNTTNIVKGIAIILMFIHHFFTFPLWWGEGISLPTMERIAPYINFPTRLCVSIFCFITGYFYSYKSIKSYKYSLKKITDVLISYLTVFFIIALIAVMFGHYSYSSTEFIYECFALYQPTMVFCWYVNFYMIFMLVLPLISRVMNKSVFVDLLLSLIILPMILMQFVGISGNELAKIAFMNFVIWLPMVLMGYIFEHYKLFQGLDKLLGKLAKPNIWAGILWVIVMLIVPMGRYFEPSITISFSNLPKCVITMDVLYTPLFIYSIVNICRSLKIAPVKKVLYQIGKYSSIMWFVSCIFFNICEPIFKPVLYAPKIPILILMWGLILCYVPAIGLDIVIKKIQGVKNRIFFASK